MIYFLPFLFLSGFLFAKLYKDISDLIIKIVMNVLVPIMILYLLQGLELNRVILNVALLGWIVIIFGIITSLIIAKVLQLDKRSLAALILILSFGNTTFLGVPYISAYYQNEGLAYLVFFDALATVAPIFIIAPLLNIYVNHSTNVLGDILVIFTKPSIIAIIGGIYFNDKEMPKYIYDSMGMIIPLIAPIAIFGVGMKFNINAFKKEIKEVSILIFIKMIITPLIVYTAVRMFLDINHIAYQVSILESALPTMFTSSLFAIMYNFKYSLVIGSIILGGVFSMISIPLWYAFIPNLSTN